MLKLILKLVLVLMLRSWCWAPSSSFCSCPGFWPCLLQNIWFLFYAMLISWFNSDSVVDMVSPPRRQEITHKVSFLVSWNTRVTNSLIFWLWLQLYASLLFIDFKYNWRDSSRCFFLLQILTSGAKIQFLFHCLSDSFFQIIAICLFKSSSSRRHFDFYWL